MSRFPVIVCVERAAQVVGLPAAAVLALHRAGLLPRPAVGGPGIPLHWSVRRLRQWAAAVRLAAEGAAR